jgi:hypothetical protein
LTEIHSRCNLGATKRDRRIRKPFVKKISLEISNLTGYLDGRKHFVYFNKEKDMSEATTSSLAVEIAEWAIMNQYEGIFRACALDLGIWHLLFDANTSGRLSEHDLINFIERWLRDSHSALGNKTKKETLLRIVRDIMSTRNINLIQDLRTLLSQWGCTFALEDMTSQLKTNNVEKNDERLDE